MKRTSSWLAAPLLALSLLAACGDDDEGATDTTEAPGDGGTETTQAGGEGEGGEGGDNALDTNGDGEVVFGIAAAGPRDDGAYYQAVVTAAEEIAEERGFGEPIVVDNIQAADAATELDNLAQQDVDVIIVGASEIAEPLPDLISQYPDIFWYCNCGAGFPENPGLAQSPTTPRRSTTPPATPPA
jgi:basic membrane lipoprotein Med (substrate-binding protein (PBP1-ABC) superfamily)